MSETQQTQAVGQVSPWTAQSGDQASTVPSSDRHDFSASAGGSAVAGQSLLGPFGLRDLVIIAAVVLIFIGTLLPLAGRGAGNFWTGSNVFFLGIGILLPLAVLVLVLLRGFKVLGTVRIGSLSLEQFSSVVASFATAYFFIATVTSIGVGFSIGYLIALIGAVVMLLSTVLSPWIPLLSGGTGAVSAQTGGAAAAGTQTQAPVVEQSTEASVDIAGSTFAEPQPSEQAEDASARWERPAEVAGVAGAAVLAAGVPVAAGAAPSGAEPETAPETNLNPLAHAETVPAEAVSVESEPAENLSVKHEYADSPQPAAEATEPAAVETAQPEPAAGEAASFDQVADAPASIEAAAATPSSDDYAAGFATSAASLEEVAQPEPAAEVKAPESFAATVDPADRPNQNTAGEVTQEAFWFAVDKPKAVVDEHTGGFLYNIEPGSWFLALQDRGYDYLVQNADGKLGVLRDLRNIERAPRDS